MGKEVDMQAVRRWSTEGVDPRRALSYWVDTVCDRFLALDIDTPLRDRFSARLEQVELGATTVNFMHAERQRVHRTRARIAHSDHSVFVLLQLREGHVRFRQGGQETLVRPGECVFIDGTQPYDLECPLRTNSLALRMPEQWLNRWVKSPGRFPARLFTGGGWSHSLNAALARLEVGSVDELALSRGAAAEHIAELLALAIGRDSSAVPTRILFENLAQTLCRRLDESDLSPHGVAREHGISKRGLHYAFAGAGTTFGEHLMRLRMERASQLLSDERLRDLPVAEVATRCGFMDPSHFARRFRQQFGLAPLQFRVSKAGTRH
jgi:AraC-like DNA-binding protein/mannose-6-phosphate isomerase-like protein (cupin superfamily)